MLSSILSATFQSISLLVCDHLVGRFEVHCGEEYFSMAVPNVDGVKINKSRFQNTAFALGMTSASRYVKAIADT